MSRRRRQSWTLVALLALCLTALLSALSVEPAGTTSPLAQRLAAAEAALDAGRVNEARDLLSALVREEPGSEKANLLYGLACLQIPDYSLARLAFERVLAINPRNDRARLELARCFYATGRPEEAKEHFGLVLSHAPPPAVRRNIEDFVRQIDAASRMWRLGGRVDAGYFYDDNVNVGPDSDIIGIAPTVLGAQTLTFLTVGEGSRPIEDNGAFCSVNLLGQYGKAKPGEWVGTGSAAFYRNWLEEAGDYESLFAQATLGARYAGMRTSILLPLSASYIGTGGDPLVNTYGFNPALVWTARGGVAQWLTTAIVEWRDYDKLDERDGVFAAVKETYRQFYGTARHNVAVGLSVFEDFADAGPCQNIGVACDIGAEIVLPWKASVYARLRYAVTDYAEREVLAPDIRSDTQCQYLVGVTQGLLDGWGLDLSLQYTDNNSSFELYQYNRTVATVRTFLSF